MGLSWVKVQLMPEKEREVTQEKIIDQGES